MSILYVLIPLALLVLGAAVWAFFWAVGSGQFDDMDTPAMRVLMDDDEAPPEDLKKLQSGARFVVRLPVSQKEAQDA